MSEATAERYAAAAIEHARATRDGNSHAANAAYDEIAAAYRALRDEGELERLLDLLDAPEPGARLWAATHVLAAGLDPQRGEAALAALAEDPDLLGFTAEMTLESWRAGQLKAPA